MSLRRLLSDEPILQGNREDGLGFGAYADVLSSFALTTPGPFTFGIHAEWGYGKTSLLRAIEAKLNEPNGSRQKVITVWFDAWQYEAEEQPLIALIVAIDAAIRRKLDDDKTVPVGVRKSLVRIRETFQAIGTGLIACAKLDARIPYGEVFPIEVSAELSGKEFIDAYNSSRKGQEAAREFKLKSYYHEAFQLLDEVCRDARRDFKIIILVDDLDRCMPTQAFRLLEVIKLVLAQPNFVFFLAVDQDIIRSYINKRYQKDLGKDAQEAGKLYMDKLIQVPFYIPTHKNKSPQFVDELLKDVDLDKKRMLKDIILMLSPTVAYSPRAIIRMVNTVILLDQIHANAGPSEIDDMVLFFAMEVSLRMYFLELHKLLSFCSKEAVEELCVDTRPKDAHAAKAWELLEQDEYSEIRNILRDTEKQYGLIWLDSANAEKRKIARELTSQKQVNILGGPVSNELITEGQRLVAAGDYKRAILSFSQLIAIYSDTPLYYFLRSKAYMQLRRFDEAIKDLETVVSLDPTNVPAYKKLGLALRRSGLHQRGIDEISRALAIMPNEPELHIALGTAKYRNDTPDYDGGIAEYDLAEKLGSINPELFIRRARARFESAHRQPSKEELALIDADILMAQKGAPGLKSAAALREKIEFYKHLWRLEKSEHNKKLPKQSDRSRQFDMLELVHGYREKDNHKRAISVLTREIKKNQANTPGGLLIERGITYYQQKKPDYVLAIQDFENADNTDDGRLEASLYFHWARALRLQAGGKRSDKKLRSTLVAMLKRSLALDPTNHEAKDWLDALVRTPRVH